MADPGLLATYPRSDPASLRLGVPEDLLRSRRRRLPRKSQAALTVATQATDDEQVQSSEGDAHEQMVVMSALSEGSHSFMADPELQHILQSVPVEGDFDGISGTARSPTRDSGEAAQSAPQPRASPRTGIPSASHRSEIPSQSFPGSSTSQNTASVSDSQLLYYTLVQ